MSENQGLLLGARNFPVLESPFYYLFWLIQPFNGKMTSYGVASIVGTLKNI